MNVRSGLMLLAARAAILAGCGGDSGSGTGSALSCAFVTPVLNSQRAYSGISRLAALPVR